MKHICRSTLAAGLLVSAVSIAWAQPVGVSRVAGATSGKQVPLRQGQLIPIEEWFASPEAAASAANETAGGASSTSAGQASQPCPSGQVAYGACSFSLPATAGGQTASAQHQSPTHYGAISGTCLSGGQWAIGNATCQVVVDGGVAAATGPAFSGSVGGLPSSDKTDANYTDRTSSLYDPNYALARRYSDAQGAAVYRGVVTTDQAVMAQARLRDELRAVLDDPSRTVQEKAAAQQLYDQGMAVISTAVEYKSQAAVAQQLEERDSARQQRAAALAEIRERATAQLRLAGVGEGAIPAVLKRIDEEFVATATTSPGDSKLTMVNGRYESESLQLVLSQVNQAMRVDMARLGITEAQWKSRQRQGDPQVSITGALAR